MYLIETIGALKYDTLVVIFINRPVLINSIPNHFYTSYTNYTDKHGLYIALGGSLLLTIPSKIKQYDGRDIKVKYQINWDNILAIIHAGHPVPVVSRVILI